MIAEENIAESEVTQEVDDINGLAEIQKGLEQIEELKVAEINTESTNSSEEFETPASPIEEQIEIGSQNEILEESEEIVEQLTLPKATAKEKKLWKEKKLKFMAIAEKNAALEDNRKLRGLLENSMDSNTYHYGKNVNSDLEHAKLAKRRAIEEGDIDALMEADIALVKAANASAELEKWSVNNKQPVDNQDYANNSNTETVSEVNNAIANDWLEEHPELQPSSKSYNRQLAERVNSFVHNLDSNLLNNGRQSEFFSQEYFNVIDGFISKVNTPPPIKSQEIPQHVGAVKKSYSSSPVTKAQNTTKIILTADEKRMCANAGLTEKEWLKCKLEELNKGK